MNSINTLITTYFSLKKFSFYYFIMLIGIFCTPQQHLFAQEGSHEVFYYENGNPSSEGLMVDGKPNGYWKTYYPDGTLKSEGKRTEFLLDSIWVFYNHQGKKSTSYTYSEGKKDGEAVFYDNEGNIKQTVIFDDGVQNGESLFFYVTGEVRKRVIFEDGKIEGTAFEFGKDGRIITLLNYENGFVTKMEEINRYDTEGRKRGKWIVYHNNGSIALEGYYTRGLKHGLFKSFDSKGNLLTLEEYDMGLLVEDSEQIKVLDIQNTYYPDGSIRSTGGYNEQGLKEGIHRIYGNTGEVVAGELFNNGVKVGDGIVDKKGFYQGMWKHFYPTGELKSEGAYVDSKRDGEWIFYYVSGKIEQKGKYVESLPHGQWTWYYENGDVLRREFYRRGYEDGESVEYAADGEVITEGEYSNGSKEGEWFYKLGDHTEKGSYLSGERHGLWKYLYFDGKLLFEGEYMGGVEVGKHKYYYPSGQLKKEGKYNSGLKVGTWKIYNPDGFIELTIRYKRGKEFKINGVKVQEGGELESAASDTQIGD